MEAVLHNSGLGRRGVVKGFQDRKRDVGNADVANGTGGNVGFERTPGFERLREGAEGRVEDNAVEVCRVIDRLAGLVGMCFGGAEVIEGGGDGLADLVCDGCGGIVGDVVGIMGVDWGELGLYLLRQCLARQWSRHFGFRKNDYAEPRY